MNGRQSKRLRRRVRHTVAREVDKANMSYRVTTSKEFQDAKAEHAKTLYKSAKKELRG